MFSLARPGSATCFGPLSLEIWGELGRVWLAFALWEVRLYLSGRALSELGGLAGGVAVWEGWILVGGGDSSWSCWLVYLQIERTHGRSHCMIQCFRL